MPVFDKHRPCYGIVLLHSQSSRMSFKSWGRKGFSTYHEFMFSFNEIISSMRRSTCRMGLSQIPSLPTTLSSSQLGESLDLPQQWRLQCTKLQGGGGWGWLNCHTTPFQMNGRCSGSHSMTLGRHSRYSMSIANIASDIGFCLKTKLVGELGRDSWDFLHPVLPCFFSLFFQLFQFIDVEKKSNFLFQFWTEVQFFQFNLGTQKSTFLWNSY